MYNLLLKDILIQKKVLTLGSIYILVMAFSFQSTGEGMFISGIVAFVYMLIQTACAYDDKNKSEIMLNSLPLTRRCIVTERYLSIFIFMAIGIIEYGIIRFIVNNLVFLPIEMFPITLEGLLGAIFPIALISSIYFPVLFKVGYVKAKMINFLLFFGVFFAIIPIGYRLKNSEYDPMFQNIIDFVNTRSQIELAGGMLLIICIMLGISYMLSVHFYKNRDF